MTMTFSDGEKTKKKGPSAQSISPKKIDTKLDRKSTRTASRHRFLSFCRNMIDKKVTVRLIDGSKIEGNLYACNPHHDEPFEIVIRCDDPSTIVIKAENIVNLSVSLPTMNQSKPVKTISTDKAISADKKSGLERELQAIDSTWITEDPMVDMNQKPTDKLGNWDQFEANKRLFNVKSSFDENLYTTPLDKSKISIEQQKAAIKLANEIEGKVSTNRHLREERNQAANDDFDNEEDRYSSVLKGGEANAFFERSVNAYKPPGIRKREEAQAQLSKVLQLDSGKAKTDTVSNNSESNGEALVEKGGDGELTESAVGDDDASAKSNEMATTLEDVEKSIIKSNEKSETEEAAEKKGTDDEGLKKEMKFQLNPNAKVFVFTPNSNTNAPNFEESSVSETVDSENLSQQQNVMDANGGQAENDYNVQMMGQAMDMNMQMRPPMPQHMYIPQQDMMLGPMVMEPMMGHMGFQPPRMANEMYQGEMFQPVAMNPYFNPYYHQFSTQSQMYPPAYVYPSNNMSNGNVNHPPQGNNHRNRSDSSHSNSSLSRKNSNHDNSFGKENGHQRRNQKMSNGGGRKKSNHNAQSNKQAS